MRKLKLITIMPKDEINEKLKNDTISKRIRKRLSVLKVMDGAVCSMENEEALEEWRMNGIPEDAYLGDYEDIALDHIRYMYVVKVFSNIVRKYGKEDF